MNTYTYKRVGTNGWIRYDVDGFGVRVRSNHDTTPYHHTYPNGYNPACNLCWLNIPHAESLHVPRN